MASRAAQRGGGGVVFALLVTVIVSSLAVLVCHGLSLSQYMEEPMWVFVAGIVICFVLVPLALYLVLHFSPAASLPSMQTTQNVVYYIFFTVFSFTAVVDLILALTLDGYVDTLKFYLDHGEPYLKSPHGCAINYWDGTAHLALYLVLCYLLLAGSRRRYRYVGLFWFGSIMNSLLVFLPGNVMGKWALEVQPSYLLNVPYVFFPLSFLWTRLQDPLPRAARAVQSSSIFSRPLDLLLAASLALSCAFFMLRLMIAMDSPIPFVSQWRDGVEPYLADGSLYPKLQSIVYATYYTPAYMACVIGLFRPASSPWLPDIAALVAGGAAQGQFSYMFGALHPLVATYPDADWLPVPGDSIHLFYVVNLLTAIVPFVLLCRACPGLKPEEFGIAPSKKKDQ